MLLLYNYVCGHTLDKTKKKNKRKERKKYKLTVSSDLINSINILPHTDLNRIENRKI